MSVISFPERMRHNEWINPSRIHNTMSLSEMMKGSRSPQEHTRCLHLSRIPSLPPLLTITTRIALSYPPSPSLDKHDPRGAFSPFQSFMAGILTEQCKILPTPPPSSLKSGFLSSDHKIRQTTASLFAYIVNISH